jgi:capsid protein
MIAKTIGPEAGSGPPMRRWDPSVPARRVIDPAGVAAGLARSKRAIRAERLGVDLSYKAAEPSIYRHDVPRLGGTADAHYALGLEFWRVRELAREFDRNDPNLGQLTDRGVDNLLGAGLRVDPQTADPKVNDTLRALWEAWADDPNACDFSGRFCFDEIERLALRHTWIDGDCFLVLDERSGSVRFEEGDRVTSWSTVSDDVVHGVVLDVTGRPRSYLFQRMRPGERKRHLSASVAPGDLIEIPAEFVVHVYFPKRATQTRGVSAFAPVFDQIGLASDIEHARLVKLQVSSCIAGFLTSEYPGAFALGGTDTTTSGFDDETELEFGEFTPGMIGKLRGGQKFDGFSPEVVSHDEGEFLEQAVRRVGLAIGTPLELAMLTAKNQSYSAMRGVVEQYKIGARVTQARFKRNLRSRIYRWKVGHWVEQGFVRPLPDITKHNVLTPAWPYIDPMVDAQADALRVEKHLASSRQVWAERGRDFDQGVIEIAEDRAALVKALQDAAKELGPDVTWRDLIALGGDVEMPQQTTTEIKGAA